MTEVQFPRVNALLGATPRVSRFVLTNPELEEGIARMLV